MLTSARDSEEAGNINQARIRANESATKALEAYNDSVDLRSQFAGASNASANASASANSGGGGILPYVIVIAVIAVIAIGVVVLQRRGRWDEARMSGIHTRSFFPLRSPVAARLE